MMTTINKFHWFWAWEDEKEEIWLREMSLKGWIFKSVSLPGNYIFEQGKPTDYVFRLDYFTNRKELAAYLQIFEDSGWDYMREMNSWQYFRKLAVKDQVMEIFTDNDSKAKKYQRILIFLVILLPIFLNTITIINRGADSTILQIIAFFFSLMLLFYTYAMVKLILRITQLRKKL
ncbi:MAG: DUF2812 domain-containing protein [Anaerolineaceae bacterium]|nr:DUF2812 domain-containing protein [Anaerolineaceae bacterium]